MYFLNSLLRERKALRMHFLCTFTNIDSVVRYTLKVADAVQQHIYRLAVAGGKVLGTQL